MKLSYCKIGFALVMAVTAAAEAEIVRRSKELGAIWLIGDSITQSNADGDTTSSPRSKLYDKLIAGGYAFTYTGHWTNNAEGLPTTGSTLADNLYQYHSGVSGSVIGTTIAGRTNMTTALSSWWTASSSRLSVIKPNVVLIMLGSNDVDLNIDLPNAATRLETLVNTVYSLSGSDSPTVFLASIPPNRKPSTTPDNVAAFNAQVPEIVAKLKTQGRDIYYVDQYADLNAQFATAMNGDKLHPNALGNELIATRWYTAIESVVNAPEPASLSLLAVGGGLMLRRCPRK